MFDDIRTEDIQKTKRILNRIGRFLNLLLLPVLISQLTYFLSFRRDPFYGYIISIYGIIVSIAVTVLAFYSVSRIVNVYDTNLRERFLTNLEKNSKFKNKIAFLFGNRQSLIELGIIALIYIIIPMNALHAVFDDFLIGTIFPNKFIFLLVLLPLMLALNIWANVSSMKYWDKYERNMSEERKQQERPKKDRRKMLALSAIAYIAGGAYGLTEMLPYIIHYTAILFSSWKIIFVIVALLLVMPIYRAVRALIKRHKFIRNLKKVCREKKYRLSKINKPYRSIFSYNKGEDFAVTICGRRYSCKMISVNMRSMPLFIFPNATGLFRITYRFLRVELFSYDKSFNYGYQAEGKKILIVNPTPKHVYTSFGGKTVELDNGDEIGEFEFYTATSFLNALSRDVIDK